MSLVWGLRLAMVAVAVWSASSARAFAEPLDFRNLRLINGWARYSPDTRPPSVAIDANDVVHLRGAISQASGTDNNPFVLPKAYRPKAYVYVPVAVGSSKAGRLTIQPDGVVLVQAASIYSDAQTLTSLEGVSFAK